MKADDQQLARPARRSLRRLALGLPMVALGAAALVFGGSACAADATYQRDLVGNEPASSAVDRRVRLLAAELDLDARQRSAVRRLLLEQREQTLKAWSDESVPAAVRIKATRSVAERTADEIRALLTEPQRQRYIKPRNRDAGRNVASGDLDAWMQGKSPASLNERFQ